MTSSSKKSVLIVDDTEVNRAILADILSDDYSIMEASNGVEAIDILQRAASQITLILLDVVMPKAGGFDVLRYMKNNDMLDFIPVIIISAETSTESIRRGFENGVVDYISRPFDPEIVLQRVRNTIMLYMKQNQLRGMIVDQIKEKERNNVLMTDILSTIVEFRNNESGMHVMQVRVITEILLEAVRKRRPEYELSESVISTISNAAALHDVGKIAVPEDILNKPGRLTAEEMDVMRQHSCAGSDMLDRLYFGKEEPLVKYAREICRWHHERWDGRGYPDGLSGDQIPVSAQAVGIADVYDALTSERVYKPPISHENAVKMIMAGECGIFNPAFLECFLDVEAEMQEKIKIRSRRQDDLFDVEQLTKEIMEKGSNSGISDRTLFLLERERMKYQFLASLSNETLFDYDVSSDVITFSSQGEDQLHLPAIVADCSLLQDSVTADIIEAIKGSMKKTRSAEPNARTELQIKTNDGSEQWYEMNIRTMWMFEDAGEEIYSCIGSLKNVHSQMLERVRLEEMAHRDPLTKLYNTSMVKFIVSEALASDIDGYSALMMLDLDDFKSANDTYGHQFGDEILLEVARLLTENTRKTDVVARVGGDEFMIFLRWIDDKKTLEGQCIRMMNALTRDHGDYKIRVSAGVAIYPEHGTDYATLFKRADQALYTSKKNGRNRLTYYTEEITEFKSMLSPFDTVEDANEKFRGKNKSRRAHD